MAELSGKTLFITGASRGIGRAIALRAARDGANVAIAAKSDVPNPRLPGTIHTVAAEVEAAGGRALALKCDIRDEDAVRAAVAATADAFGGLDIRHLIPVERRGDPSVGLRPDRVGRSDRSVPQSASSVAVSRPSQAEAAMRPGCSMRFRARPSRLP